jgi:hypothetical protein
MKKLNQSQKNWNKNLEERYKEEKIEMKNKKEKAIKEFEQLKKKFFEIDTDETIKKWKILSKAYELGKQIHGNGYSIFRLSEDFDFPYTTAKRILSLNHATKQSWNLINEGKISAFRVAQICMTKNHTYQDEVVKMVIKDNLTTNQVKKLRVDSRGDIKEARLNAALEKGFSRKEVAYRGLRDTLNRLNKLLTMKKEDLPDSKIIELINLMENTKEQLQKKINEFNNL